MKNKNHYLKLIFTGAVTAVAIGTTYFVIKEQSRIRRQQRALDRVRALFKDEGNIIGSYIETTPKPFKHANITTMAYFGGITREKDGQVFQYEFVLSAKTYTLIDLKLIA